MLSELKLSNFRIFDDEVTVRFRPITVLIGRNSSGKSTIVKFLLMLQQSLWSTGSDFPKVDGSYVKLGPFAELKNSVSSKTNLAFEVSMRSPFVGRETFDSGPLQEYVKVAGDALIVTVRGAVPYSDNPSAGSIDYSLGQTNPTITLMNFSTSVAEDYAFSMSAITGAIDEFKVHFQEATSLSELEPAQAEHVRALIDDFTKRAELGAVLQAELSAASHVSPTRAEPQRVIVTSYSPPDYMGPEGRGAIAHLRRIKAEDEKAYQFLLPHLRNVSGVASVDFETESEEVTRAIGRNPTTGADVPIADFGFGVGQSVPVLVQGAMMPHQATLMVEQPEAQLHPTAQLEMGSFFADLWTKRHVRSIVETHSSNILLRLRRLVAKGELSHRDVSVAYFDFDNSNENMPIITNLDVNEDGSMQAGLPMEFFGADVIEGLQLGARA